MEAIDKKFYHGKVTSSNLENSLWERSRWLQPFMILTLWSSKLSNGHCSVFTWLGKVYGGRITILCLLCVIVKAIGSNALVTALCRSYHKDLEENQWEGLKESTITFWQGHAAFLMCWLSSITFCKLCPFHYFLGNLYPYNRKNIHLSWIWGNWKLLGSIKNLWGLPVDV